jgi:DNA polymerase III gamma/tau subunit
LLGLVDRNLLYQMLEGMLAGLPDKCLNVIHEVYSYGYDLTEFTSEILELLRNATMVGLSPSSQKYIDVSEDERVRLDALARDVPPEVFVRSFQVMLEVHDQVARARRPRTTLEMAVARLVSIRPARPLDQVLDRLGDLERRIRHGGVSTRPRTAPRRSQPATPAPSTDDDGDPAPAPPQQPPTPPDPPPEPPIQETSEPPRPPEPITVPKTAVVPPTEAVVTPSAPEPASESENSESENSNAARFAAFQDWLETKGERFELWVRDSALGEVRPPVVQVLFPSRFRQQAAAEFQQEPIVHEGIRLHFPACNRAELGVRNAEAVLTQRETRAVAESEHLAALQEEMKADPLVKRIQERFEATVRSISVPEHPPDIVGGREGK